MHAYSFLYGLFPHCQHAFGNKSPRSRVTRCSTSYASACSGITICLSPSSAACWHCNYAALNHQINQEMRPAFFRKIKRFTAFPRWSSACADYLLGHVRLRQLLDDQHPRWLLPLFRGGQTIRLWCPLERVTKLIHMHPCACLRTCTDFLAIYTRIFVPVILAQAEPCQLSRYVCVAQGHQSSRVSTFAWFADNSSRAEWIYIYIYIYVYIHTHIYTYACIYIYIYTHTNI